MPGMHLAPQLLQWGSRELEKGLGALTCLPYKDLVGGTRGPLASRVVHAHADLIPLVLVQV